MIHAWFRRKRLPTLCRAAKRNHEPSGLFKPRTGTRREAVKPFTQLDRFPWSNLFVFCSVLAMLISLALRPEHVATGCTFEANAAQEPKSG